MADGALAIRLEKALRARVEQAAQAAGSSVDAFVARALEFAVDPDPEWAIDETIANDALAAGDGVPLDQFLERLDRFGRPMK